MRIAALQFQPRFLDKEYNIRRIGEYISSIECDLIVLPELCFSGYYFIDRTQVTASAEPSDGETNSYLHHLAQKKNCALVAGFAERDGNTFFNSAALITPDGIEGIYRKTHLFGEEKIWFAPGDTGFQVFQFRGAGIGIMVCYDWRFPESARSLALKGADIICHPSNLVTDEGMWKIAMRARSIENKVYTITANRTGEERKNDAALRFTGCSQITNPDGFVIAEMNREEEGFIAVDADPFSARDKSFSPWNDLLRDRRTEMYEK